MTPPAALLLLDSGPKRLPPALARSMPHDTVTAAVFLHTKEANVSSVVGILLTGARHRNLPFAAPPRKLRRAISRATQTSLLRRRLLRGARPCLLGPRPPGAATPQALGGWWNSECRRPPGAKPPGLVVSGASQLRTCSRRGFTHQR